MMICVLILLFSSSPVSSEGLRELGHFDFNGDDIVNLGDALIVLKVLTGSSPALVSAEEPLPIGTDEVLHILQMLGTPYEEDDEISQASLILVDDPRSQVHDFHDSGDEDWLMFYGNPEISYVIEIRPQGSEADIVSELYGTDGLTNLDPSWISDGGDIQVLDCVQEGLHYVRIRNADPEKSGENTAYTVRIHFELPLSAENYEEDGTPTQASPISADDPAPQHHDFHDEGDKDWVRFAAMQGKPYVIEAKNLGRKSNVLIELYGTDGETLLRPEEGGEGEELVKLTWSTFSKDGTYYAKIRNRNPMAFGEDTEYSLSVYIPNAEMPLGGVVGYLKDSSDNSLKILDASITRESADASSPRPVYYNSLWRIYYAPWLENRTYTLRFHAEGYKDHSFEIKIEDRTIRKDIFMERLSEVR